MHFKIIHLENFEQIAVVVCVIIFINEYFRKLIKGQETVSPCFCEKKLLILTLKIY